MISPAGLNDRFITSLVLIELPLALAKGFFVLNLLALAEMAQQFLNINYLVIFHNLRILNKFFDILYFTIRLKTVEN